MILYLLRHGEAETFSSSGDRDRTLTEHGMSQCKIAGKYLIDKHPSIVLISTYARARETLELVNLAGGSCTLREFVSLDVAPGGSIEDLLIEIHAYHEESLLVVGHNPQLSRLIFKLTGKNVVMGNCSFAEIDLETSKLLEFVTIEEMTAAK